MVLGGGGFGKWLGHDSRALMNGISALIKETPVSNFAASTKWGHSETTADCEPGSGPSLDHEPTSVLVLDILDSNCEK